MNIRMIALSVNLKVHNLTVKCESYMMHIEIAKCSEIQLGTS